MAVRITKPAFNIREKLSELDKPAGIEFFNILLTSVTASKSPGEAIGKPASIISIPSSSKTLAI